MGKFEWITKNTKLVCFAAGAVAAAAGGAIARSKKAHDICVAGVAKGMQIRDCAKEKLRTIKDEAEDICFEAKQKAAEDTEIPEEV